MAVLLVGHSAQQKVVKLAGRKVVVRVEMKAHCWECQKAELLELRWAATKASKRVGPKVGRWGSSKGMRKVVSRAVKKEQ